MKPNAIHLEHALPVLADLGLGAVLPLLRPGAEKDPDAIAGAIVGLASGAEKHTIRHLVAISRATGEELLAWEETPDAKSRALKSAALADFGESVEAVKDFFSSLRSFLPSTPGSSQTAGLEMKESAATNPASVTAP